MSRCLALLCRTAIADLGMNNDYRRSVCVCLGCLNSCSDGVKIISVLYLKYAEAVCFHALCHIFPERNVCISLNGNIVGVIDHDQLSKSQSTCQRESLRGKSLHHAAVSAQYIGIVVYNFAVFFIKYSSQMSLSHSHAHCHAHTLSQRTCGGFYANGMAILRMARCQGASLAEILNIINGEISVSKQMEQRIQQHGAMAS